MSAHPLPEKNDRFAWFLGLITFVVVVAALRVGEDVLMPVAFAILLAFLLSPLTVRLTRWGLPSAAAIMLTVTVAFGVIGATGWIVTAQALALVRQLPNYEENISRKIAALKAPNTPTAVSRMTGMVENLRREIKAPAAEASAQTPLPGEEKPVPVEVKSSNPTPLQLATDAAPPVLRMLGTAAIVIVFVVVILFQRADLRDRLIRLLSTGQSGLASKALDDAAARVSRYLGMQLVVNATYGVPLAVGLYFIGIPNAPLWGLIATLLRFLPFVGPWIAAAFPVSLAIAVDPGWTMVIYTLALFLVLEVISNNIVEVKLYGSSTGISSFALLVAAVFWTWLWGAPGLVLSTPLTVCVLVLGNYLPGFSLLSMLLGNQPVLEPPAQFYQRMLALESEEMIDLAEKHIRERSLEVFYDEVVVPALLMAGDDRQRGTLPEARHPLILQATREMLEELARRDPEALPQTDTRGTGSLDVSRPASTAVWLIPARDASDEIVALALRHLLRRRGIDASVTPYDQPRSELLAVTREPGVHATVISALPPSALSGVRQAVRRLKYHVPEIPHFAGVWQGGSSREELIVRLRDDEPADVFTTLGAAVKRLTIQSQSETAASEPAPSIMSAADPSSPAITEKIAAK